MPGENAPVLGTYKEAEQSEQINDVRKVDYNIETGENIRYNPYGDIQIEFDVTTLDTDYQR